MYVFVVILCGRDLFSLLTSPKISKLFQFNPSPPIKTFSLPWLLKVFVVKMYLGYWASLLKSFSVNFWLILSLNLFPVSYNFIFMAILASIFFFLAVLLLLL